MKNLGFRAKGLPYRDPRDMWELPKIRDNPSPFPDNRLLAAHH